MSNEDIKWIYRKISDKKYKGDLSWEKLVENHWGTKYNSLIEIFENIIDIRKKSKGAFNANILWTPKAVIDCIEILIEPGDHGLSERITKFNFKYPEIDKRNGIVEFVSKRYKEYSEYIDIFISNGYCKKDILYQMRKKYDPNFAEKTDYIKEEFKECCYIFYNKDGDIIYIGYASTLSKRININGHISKHLPEECYNQIDKIIFKSFDSKHNAELCERFLVGKYQPKYNKIFKGKNPTIDIPDFENFNDWHIMK